jgi:hypothetical protein
MDWALAMPKQDREDRYEVGDNGIEHLILSSHSGRMQAEMLYLAVVD